MSALDSRASVQPSQGFGTACVVRPSVVCSLHGVMAGVRAQASRPDCWLQTTSKEQVISFVDSADAYVCWHTHNGQRATCLAFFLCFQMESAIFFVNSKSQEYDVNSAIHDSEVTTTGTTTCSLARSTVVI